MASSGFAYNLGLPDRSFLRDNRRGCLRITHCYIGKIYPRVNSFPEPPLHFGGTIAGHKHLANCYHQFQSALLTAHAGSAARLPLLDDDSEKAVAAKVTMTKLCRNIETAYQSCFLGRKRQHILGQ